MENDKKNNKRRSISMDTMKYENGQYLKLKNFESHDTSNETVIAKIIQKKEDDDKTWYETIYSTNQYSWQNGDEYTLIGWKIITKITKQETLAWTL